MAKKKSPEQNGPKKVDNPNVLGLQAQVLEQPITQTLEVNYMPYAMSVIVSRAIPEIDGFKPSHRKLLYTMYQMHLLGGSRTKSANVVGATMKLNPHGDAAIYDTLVRLSRGYGALLHPLGISWPPAVFPSSSTTALTWLWRWKQTASTSARGIFRFPPSEP